MLDFTWCLIEYAQSIFEASVIDRTAPSLKSSCSSERQSITVKRAEYAAQLAAKEAEVQMEDAIAAQKQELKRLENQRDLQVMAAKLRVYSEAEGSETHDRGRVGHVETTTVPSVPPENIKREQACNNNVEQTNTVKYETLLVQALHDSMVLTRLPAPEPSIFSGDPLHFLDWSTSFKTLIERRCTNAADKLFYLQKYIGGEARSVFEGTFFRKDDEAYDQAWETLQACYGHPFVIQCAFREKLNNWPKMGL